MSTRKCLQCKDRDQHGLVRNGFLNNKRLCNSQARVPSYGYASMPGGPRSGDFPNLGVNPMSYQGNMPSGPVGASLGGLTPQAAQIQEVMAMLGSMTSTTLHTFSLAQVNSQAKAFMSAWTLIHLACFEVMQDMPLCPMANRFGGCFCLDSGPVLWFLFCFCCLLRCFR